MSSQALQRRTPVSTRSFNPSTYRAEALELMEANPALAANSMTQLAKSKREAERDLNMAEDSTSDIVAFLASSLIVAAIGAYDGTVMAKRDQLIETFEAAGTVLPGQEPTKDVWKSAGVKEPGKLWIFPTALLVPILLGAGAVIVAGRRDEDEPATTGERILAVSATSSFGLWLASITRASGYRYQQKRMLNAGVQAAMTGT